MSNLGYISVDKLIDFANNHINKTIDANDIVRFPRADVKERKYGKWIKKKHLIPLAWDSSPFIWENYDEETHSEWKEYWNCSECGYEASRDMKPRFKYCPECGIEIKLNDSEE